ncbi:hypothetical protein AB3464_03160 [Pseudomonas asplenii]|uniref:DUF7919 family protein n=1 Tax=Pseudomonas asplenii TaxID=53407 RepID=UPI0037CB7000
MKENNIFCDLTDYSHDIAPYILEGVKNVGWIDVEAGFSLGDMPRPIFDKLRSLAGASGCFKPVVESIREIPSCKICGEFRFYNSVGKLMLESQLWIPAREVIYASPLAILHYIEVHDYLPPAEFISAIEAIDESFPFVAADVYRDVLHKSEWGKLSGKEKMALAKRGLEEGQEKSDLFTMCFPEK